MACPLLPQQGVEAHRGVWVATPEHNQFYSAAAEMARQLDAFKGVGIDTVYVAMWNQGRTLYPSAVMKRLTGVEIEEKLVRRDPLREVVDLAHARGLKVVAWLEFGFASDYRGGPGNELAKLKPDWVARDRHGAAVAKNGFHWLNGLHPEVQTLLLDLTEELLTRYPLDGVQGDDRLPALPSIAGYDEHTRARFRAEHDGREPPDDAREPAWLRWRANQLNDFARRFHQRVKATRPNALVSFSPSPYPWGYDEYLQDWPTWVRQGWVDRLSPQIYRYDIAAYQQTISEMVLALPCATDRAKVFPGVLLSLGRDYVASPALLKAMIEVNRTAGLNGEVFFHSAGIEQRADVLRATQPTSLPISVRKP
jgi:uncharacterized lipoprotein YddW (UPF0748 family)